MPKWRGFNRLNLLDSVSPNSSYDDGGLPINEADFALMQKMGFNFVRYPIDYRYIYNPVTQQFIEDKLKWLDDAIRFGEKYNVHVKICLHTAPGYSVVYNFNDGLNLLTTGKPHFIKIWEHLANRYKDKPNRVVSFNLVNEPHAVQMVFPGDGRALNPLFIALIRDTINAIRAFSPNRLIVLDTDMRVPLNLSLFGLSTIKNIVQSPHNYAPFSVTHEGMGGQSEFPDITTGLFPNRAITWPITNYFNGFLYAPIKSRQLFGMETTRAVINHLTGFPGRTLSIRTVRVSGPNTLTLAWGQPQQTASINVPANTPANTILSFPANTFPANQTKLELYISNEGGDWIVFDQIVITAANPADNITVNATNVDWGYPPNEITIGVNKVTNAQTIRDMLLPSPMWDDIPVIIGEMGCMAQNVTQATYRANLMRDYVDAMGDLPWAFWEFKGGAMSLFRLSGQTTIFTQQITIEYTPDGETTPRTQSYRYDGRWYDAIKHVLDIPK